MRSFSSRWRVASTTANTTEVPTVALPEGPEESTIYVEPIDGISDDFYRGMDTSAVLALENSGVKYYNFDGDEQDVFLTLAQASVNYIRLRVWNDPYDENGNGYGGDLSADASMELYAVVDGTELTAPTPTGRIPPSPASRSPTAP